MKKVFTLIILLSNLIFAGELTDKSAEYLSVFFNDKGNVKIESEKFIIPREFKIRNENKFKQKFYTDYLYLYRIKLNDEIIAYAILDNVLGKVQPITFLVICDTLFNIKDVQIIKYREEHGGEIQNESWRKQFVNKKPYEELVLGSNIDGISGATISVKSIVKGVNKTIYLLKELFGNEKN